jgi:MoaA/NifB/PqqE/SkfB family radical SAM enzyme
MGSKLKSNYMPEAAALIFGRTKPSMVTVNLTNRCNQQCIYCEIGKDIPSSENEFLDLDDLKWIIDEMSLLNIPRISLCGGEPFLFDGILDIVQYAGNKNIRCTITSNGMTVFKLNEKDLSVFREFKTLVNISIDSFEDEIQSRTRGNSQALQNALKSINTLNNAGIPVTVLTVISKYNYHKLFDFATEVCEKGITQLLFQPVIYSSNYPDRDAINEKSQINVPADKLDILMDELKKIHHYERTHKINTNVYRILPWIKSYLTTSEAHNREWFFNDVLNKFYCRELYAIIDIAYDGGIQPCGLAKASINIRKNKEQGLLASWLEATKAIKDDIENERFHTYCNACCHHFSRNMLASIIRYPVSNRIALMHMTTALLSRAVTRLSKTVYTR